MLDKGWVKPNKRIFDNSKISDHFAIIPTLQAPKNLSEPEQKLYDLVVKRFLSVFFPAAEYPRDHAYHRSRRVITSRPKARFWWSRAGCRCTAAKSAVKMPTSCRCRRTRRSRPTRSPRSNSSTKPPARYNEATLLSAMEGAGKLVEDDELREAMAAKGLGTPATRAAIIEGLLGEKYLIREGARSDSDRQGIPADDARCAGLGVKELTAPELTGEWEYKLSQMERGNLPRDAFMQEIARMTQTIVKRAKEYDSDTIPGDYATLRNAVSELRRPGEGKLPPLRVLEVRVLDLEDSGRPPVRDRGSRGTAEEQNDRAAVGFSQQDGPSVLGDSQAFARRRDQELQARVRLRPGRGRRRRRTARLLRPGTGRRMPKCKGRVFEHGMSYVCENSVASPKTCDFRSGKVILQQEIAREQMAKLLEEGRTDLLTNFKSSRTGRNFKAFLVKQNDGKIGFEFEKKEPSGPRPRRRRRRQSRLRRQAVRGVRVG